VRSTNLFAPSAVGLVLVGAILGACSSSAETSSAQRTTGPEAYDDESDAGPAAPLSDAGSPADALAPKPQATIGSPLCAADKNTCFPDDEFAGSGKRRGGYTCSGAEGDGGDAAPQTCRVVKGGVQPACVTAGTGREEARCKVGSDCAAGFECVAPGVCRRYCCAGSCDSGNATIDSGRTFCNLEPQHESQDFVPVCSPVKACQPLEAKGGCDSGFTCAISGSSGASCVAIGKAQVGEACEKDHCGAGLTCLGSWGSRKCYQLCRVGGTDCTGGRACKSSSALSFEGLGVCETM
jgi:hypothetical protein